jgi:HK97 family phage prohead protease
MDHAAFDIVEFKADTSGPRGLFAALVSVFGNVDRNGDRVLPGAFTKSVERWRASGRPIPVIWSHEHRDPEAYIGEVDPADVKETDRGLVVAGRLDIETSETAAQVFDLLQRGRVKDWSFAYEVTDSDLVREDSQMVRNVREVELFEVGPTLVGANAATATLSVASAQETKAVDTSAWDGNRAMGQCDSAADYRSICAGERTTGEPGERQHWALPHHYLGRGPNAAGVRNALARLSQTEGLSNREAAERHLEAHMSEVNPEAAAEVETKRGRVLSARNEARLREARATLDDILSLLETEEEPQTIADRKDVREPTLTEVWAVKVAEAALYVNERS